MASEVALHRRVSHLAQRLPPRLVYGNDALNNFGGDRRLRAMRRLAPGPALTTQGADAGERLHHLGWAPIAPVPAPVVSDLIAGYRRVIDDESITQDMGGRIKQAVRYIVEPHIHVPAIRAVLDDAALDVLRGYYGTCFRLLHCRMWRIRSIPTEEQRFHHYGNLWHTDPHDRHTMKLFVQISDDVTADNGAFRLHDIPATKRIMRSGYVWQTTIVGPAAQTVEDRSTIYFDAPPGGRIFCNACRCLHRAGVPRESRGMLQLTFAPSTQPVDDLFGSMEPDRNVLEGGVA